MLVHQILSSADRRKLMRDRVLPQALRERQKPMFMRVPAIWLRFAYELLGYLPHI
jgi:hypothetical protein